jgi:hypothetical protein
MTFSNSFLGNDKLFQSEANPYSAYLVHNTYKNFCDCCSELCKLVGPDNLNAKLIKQLLSERFNLGGENFVHKESGRKLSPL